MAKKHKYKCTKCGCKFERIKEKCECPKCGCNPKSKKCECCK